MPRYGMIIDIGLCTGCQACTVACQMENLTQPGCVRTILIEAPGTSWSVRMCMQCEEPPCVPVCPADATSKNELGVTVVDQNLCIGCGACVEACPYDARSLNPSKGHFAEPLPYEEIASKESQTHRIHMPDTADKCDFCLHRISAGDVPMCVEACTTGARIFGDLDCPHERLARAMRTAEVHRPELRTRPRVYLATPNSVRKAG